MLKTTKNFGCSQGSPPLNPHWSSALGHWCIGISNKVTWYFVFVTPVKINLTRTLIYWVQVTSTKRIQFSECTIVLESVSEYSLSTLLN